MEYGWILLRTTAVLVAVCALAYASLRWGLQRYANFQPQGPRRLEVVERLGVGPKRALLVVRTADQVWLVGSSEGGLQALGQLEPTAWLTVGDSREEEAYDSADVETP